MGRVCVCGGADWAGGVRSCASADPLPTTEEHDYLVEEHDL